MNSKMLSSLYIGRTRKILKATQEKIREIEKDTSLENPIMSDIVMSTKANAYEELLSEYKKYKKEKEKEKEDEQQ